MIRYVCAHAHVCLYIIHIKNHSDLGHFLLETERKHKRKS